MGAEQGLDHDLSKIVHCGAEPGVDRGVSSPPQAGTKGTGDQEARKVDAFLILEQELAEINGASHAGRQTNGASRRGKDA